MAELGDKGRAKRSRQRIERTDVEKPQETSSSVQQPLPMYHPHHHHHCQEEEEESMGLDNEDTLRRHNDNSITRWNNNSGSSERKGVVAVVGVGPGLGYSIVQRFVHEGYTVAIFARNKARLERFVKEIAEKETNALLYAIKVDCSDLKEVKQAFESVRSFGFVELLVYNVSTPQLRTPSKFMDIDPESFGESLTLPCLGAFYCAQQVLPSMVEKKRGTVIFTGSSTSIRGQIGYAKSSCGKFALRALAQCLAHEFQPKGVHVAHVILDGSIRKTDGDDDLSRMNPEAIAEAYWHLHLQDQGAWTHELDLRPLHEQSR